MLSVLLLHILSLHVLLHIRIILKPTLTTPGVSLFLFCVQNCHTRSVAEDMAGFKALLNPNWTGLVKGKTVTEVTLAVLHTIQAKFKNHQHAHLCKTLDGNMHACLFEPLSSNLNLAGLASVNAGPNNMFMIRLHYDLHYQY